jgi:hypothetical protein
MKKSFVFMMIAPLSAGLCLALKLIKKGITSVWSPYIFLLIFPLLLSCATNRNVIDHRNACIIEKVPFHPQETYKCGPASLSSVLDYWGVNVSPEDIAAEIFSESAKGTLNIDMTLYARNIGLEAVQYKGSIKDIRDNICLGYPVIVMVDYGFWVYQQNHFMVVIGYDKNVVIVRSGRDQFRLISEEKFVRAWKRTNFWTLLVKPRL